jgi:hypothetical protein
VAKNQPNTKRDEGGQDPKGKGDDKKPTTPAGKAPAPTKGAK